MAIREGLGDREIAFDDMTRVAGGASLWQPRPETAAQEARIARVSVERISVETGVNVTPYEAELVAWGLRAVMVVLGEHPGRSGPLPGQTTGLLPMVRLRDRRVELTGIGVGRPVPALLRHWHVLDDQAEVDALSALVTGWASWDGEVFGSSAVWAATRFAPHQPLPTTDAAAVGWAKALHRLRTGTAVTKDRNAVAAQVMSHRDLRGISEAASAAARPADFGSGVSHGPP